MNAGNIFFGVGIVAGVALIAKYLIDVYKTFRFKIVGYGMPSITNWILTLPITIQFNNTSGLKLTADSIQIDVFIKLHDDLVHVGQMREPVEIETGVSQKTFIPIVNIQAATSVLINTWRDIISRKAIDIVSDVTVTYKGVNLPTRRIEETVKI